MIVGPCIVVTGGPEPAVIEDAAVRVVGAHIAHVATAGTLAAAYPEETLWLARGRVLMPGLVNTHAHLARHLARGLGLRTPGEWRLYDRALSSEDVSWAVSAALIEGVRHGVTTVCDFHRSGGCLDLSLSEVIAAADRVGVRVATCYGASEADRAADRNAAIDECLSFANELSRSQQGRLQGMLGIEAVSLEGVETMLHRALDDAGEQLAVHVDLALDLTPAERWRARSPWRESPLPALWAHAERAPRGLLGAVQQRGDALSVTGSGSTAALAREVEIAWGSDAGANAPPLPDPAGGFGFDRQAEAHYQRLFVTGARWAARHFGAELGQIKSGAPADLMLLDYRPATEFSTRTLLAHLGSGLLRAPVSGVMVAGDVVMDNGQLTRVDEGEVAARARECAKRVWERMG